MARSASEFDLNMHFLRESLWPAVIYTLLLIIAGGIGNSFVLIVYRRNFLRSTTRMFIYSLAILDLANCLLTMPSELAILMAFSSFPSQVWCRLSRYLTYTFNGSSSIILIVIAFDRFNKICRPTKQHLTIDRGRKICLAAFIFAAVCAIPALILYGEVVLPIHLIDGNVHIISFSEIHNHTRALETSSPSSLLRNPSGSGHDIVVMGYFCLINSEYIDSELPLLFYLSMFSMYLVMVICIVYFYVRVAREMYLLQRRFSVFQTPAFQRTCPSIIHEEPPSENHDKQPVLNIYGSNRSFDFSKSDNLVEEEKYVVNPENNKELEGGAFTKRSEEGVETLGVDLTSREENLKHENSEASSSNVAQADLTQEDKDARVEKQDTTKVDDKTTALNSKDTPSTTPGEDLDAVDGEKSARPLSSNKLLIRRIKSAEDLKAFKLDRLQVSNRSPAERKSTEKKKSKGKEFIYRNRNSVRASKSCNNLHKTHEKRTYWDINQIESADPFLTPSNTLTLTRASPKGGKRCMLALEGLSSKRVKNFEADGKFRNSAPLRADAPSKPPNETQSSENKSSVVSPNQLTVPEPARPHRNSPPMTRAVRDEAGSSPEVQLRSKCSGEDESNGKAGKPGRSVDQGVPRTPRAQVFSTGDILSDNQQVRSLHPGRTSRMLFIISLVFVISFLPFFLIVIVRTAAGSSFMSSLSPAVLGVVSVFIRSSLISNAVNPIIYGILSTHFRRQCTTLLPSCLKKRLGKK